MKKADVFVISALIAICIAFLFLFYGTNEGTYAEIYINNQKQDTVFLNKNIKKTYESENGGKNTVVVKNKKVYVNFANCKDGVCIKSGKKHKKGEIIVCAPHRFLVEVH